MESVILGHSLLPHQNSVSFFNLLENLNVGFTLSAVYLLSFVGILGLSLLINELSHRVRYGAGRTAKVFDQLSSAVSSFRVKRLSAIGIFVLFVHLFLWITELFLTNNIKTNKVVSLSFQWKISLGESRSF